jgi:hypothetical protein
MRRATSLISAVVLGSLAFGAPPVRAADVLHCVSIHDIALSPGLSIQPSSGSITARSGTMECHGPVNGRTPTGIGNYREDARYGTKDPDTCQEGGEAEGVFSSTVPTEGGDQLLEAAFTALYGDLTANPGAVSGQFEGRGVRGTIKATPLEGDCIVRPVTRVRIHADFYFAQSFFQR